MLGCEVVGLRGLERHSGGGDAAKGQAGTGVSPSPRAKSAGVTSPLVMSGYWLFGLRFREGSVCRAIED